MDCKWGEESSQIRKMRKSWDRKRVSQEIQKIGEKEKGRKKTLTTFVFLNIHCHPKVTKVQKECTHTGDWACNSNKVSIYLVWTSYHNTTISLLQIIFELINGLCLKIKNESSIVYYCHFGDCVPQTQLMGTKLGKQHATKVPGLSQTSHHPFLFQCVKPLYELDNSFSWKVCSYTFKLQWQICFCGEFNLVLQISFQMRPNQILPLV